MTTKEALLILNPSTRESALEKYRSFNRHTVVTHDDGETKAFEDAIIVAVNALDRHTRKTIFIDNNYVTGVKSAYCPKCNKYMGILDAFRHKNHQPKYCSNCGQALKYEHLT